MESVHIVLSSLFLNQVLLQVVAHNLPLVREEPQEEGILSGIECGGTPVVEIPSNFLVEAEHPEGYFFESDILVDIKVPGQLHIDFELDRAFGAEIFQLKSSFRDT